MTVEKYKKYQQYNLIILTLSILLMFLFKDKNNLYYIGIIGFVLGISFGSWSSIQILDEYIYRCSSSYWCINKSNILIKYATQKRAMFGYSSLGCTA